MSCLVARLMKGGQRPDLIQLLAATTALFRVSLSGFMSSLRTGREIPSFLILATSKRINQTRAEHPAQFYV
jgi:hypothetical protein